MARLTKAQAGAHQDACRLLEQDRLSDDDRLFVLEHWQASARHINSVVGAYFTPIGLARDFSIEVGPGRVIDLCAGIGALSLFAFWRAARQPIEITCVETNPDYVAVGRKIVPEATWIIGDVFNLPLGLDRFDVAISNPPFGAVKRVAGAPRYRGREFELHVIDIASDLADRGVFIIPQVTAGFKYSGCPDGGWPETRRDGTGSGFADVRDHLHDKLFASTGIALEPSCGIDTSLHDKDWHGVSLRTEVVTVDFERARQYREPILPLFLEAAE